MKSPLLRLLLLSAVVVVLLPACSSTAGGGGGRSTTDARVRPLSGTTAMPLPTDGVWLNARGPTSLAGLRGRVVYVQFAFPT